MEYQNSNKSECRDARVYLDTCFRQTTRVRLSNLGKKRG